MIDRLTLCNIRAESSLLSVLHAPDDIAHTQAGQAEIDRRQYHSVHHCTETSDSVAPIVWIRTNPSTPLLLGTTFPIA